MLHLGILTYMKYHILSTELVGGSTAASQVNSTGMPPQQQPQQPATVDEFDMFAQSRQTTFQDSRKRLVIIYDPVVIENQH